MVNSSAHLISPIAHYLLHMKQTSFVWLPVNHNFLALLLNHQFPLLSHLYLFLLISLTFQKRQWQPTPVLLPGKSHGQRILVVHGVAKSRTRLSDFTFTFHFHALEKEMATSVLAWRIPGMEEPGGLPSMGSHRVGHD